MDRVKGESPCQYLGNESYSTSYECLSVSDQRGFHSLNKRKCYSGSTCKEARRHNFFCNVQFGSRNSQCARAVFSLSHSKAHLEEEYPSLPAEPC